MSIVRKICQHVNSITPYQPGKPIEEVAREIGLDPDSIVKLASNECPLGPSPKAVKAIKNSAKQMHLYPDGGAWAFRQKLASKLGVGTDQLIFGNGSNEILEFVAHCFVRPGMSVVASDGAFIVYKLVTKMMGGEFIEVPMAKGFKHDLNAMAKAIRPDTSVVFICNPNNPTSTLLSQAELDKFMEKVPHGVLVVFDEAYREICLKKMPDTMKYLKDGKEVLILRTFSKAYGLAGLRVGYGLSTPDVIKSLEKPRQPFNLNAMSQAAAIAALDDDAFVRRVTRQFRRGAKDIIAYCKDAGLEYVEPAANFMLIKVGDGMKVFAELQKLGVIVRPLVPYKMPEWIRVSFGTDAENAKFISAMKAVVKK